MLATDETNIIMWYFNKKPIYQAQNKLTTDPRITRNEDFSLQIENVQVSDEGVYSCQLLPNQVTVKIELEVKTPPRDVKLMHGNRILNETVEVEANERKFILLCSAKGHPTAQITWYYKGRHLDQEYSRQMGIVPRKEFLEVHTVKAKHAGDYECLAQNGIGEPVSRTVTVVVKDGSEELYDDENESFNVTTTPPEKGKPNIHKHSGYVNTAIGENVELVCLYDSYPSPTKIQWLKNDGVIQPSAQTTITNDHHNHHDRTRLLVKNIQQKDLVAYYCRIDNELGNATSKTIVGLQPGGAHLMHSNFSDGLLHTWWKIHSKQPIAEVQLFYKGEMANYVVVDAEITSYDQNQDGNSWMIRKSIRLPEGTWFVTARARNTEGWSSAENTPHQFQIPNAMDNIQVASIGGGTGASHRTLPVVPAVLLALLLLPFCAQSLAY
ncbi:opioid-binding protein/cell adhesion molecule, putative [Anopheles sinensis]|uniref:Opioid-binding protein/cell adhesion molecule, putative n=1 Tax=Anopheles sinensis TaxID=74873 RepID=A0A084WBI4_ANOSI|nr:opioid-binding protein/cell adhesion molecule, putative [Anopheles sinensis]